VLHAQEGRFIARLERIRYYAVLSRKDSWLAEHREDREAFLVGHQQLHFDIAEAFAKWLNAGRDARSEGMQGAGASPGVATGQLQLELAKHMLAVREDLDALETEFDERTKHGLDTERQTEWVFKIGDGLEAIAEGIKLQTRPKKR
jgi:hypothetical protein